jgi:hypothetical protein
MSHLSRTNDPATLPFRVRDFGLAATAGEFQ